MTDTRSGSARALNSDPVRPRERRGKARSGPVTGPISRALVQSAALSNSIDTRLPLPSAAPLVAGGAAAAITLLLPQQPMVGALSAAVAGVIGWYLGSRAELLLIRFSDERKALQAGEERQLEAAKGRVDEASARAAKVHLDRRDVYDVIEASRGVPMP